MKGIMNPNSSGYKEEEKKSAYNYNLKNSYGPAFTISTQKQQQKNFGDFYQQTKNFDRVDTL